MEVEVFEIEPGRWAYRGEGVYQEWHPDLAGEVPMTQAQASELARVAAQRLAST